MSSFGSSDDGMTTANRYPPAANETELYCPACDQSFAEGVAHCPNDGTRLVRLNDVKDPLIGRNLERRFLIKERLGTGGMGAVYRAWQGSVGREVAVKVIEARLKGGRLAAKRFLREAKLASRLSHANTVSVIDFGQTEDGLLYLVMELVKGRTLGDVLLEDGRFGVDRMVRVGVQLCDALEAAHKLAIIHRDLKPSNIILLDEPRGRDHVKVLDFGLAKSLADEGSTTMTQSDAIMGTPSYIPPEAVTLMQFDERSDLYSLGVILYEVLAGRLPFNATTVQEMLRQHAYDQPQPLPPDVAPPVAGFLYRLLSKQPDHRPQTAAEVRDILLSFAGVPDRVTPLPLSAPVDMRYGRAVTGGGQPAALPLSSVGGALDRTITAQRGPRWWMWGSMAAILAVAALVALIVSSNKHTHADTAAAQPAAADTSGAGHAADAGGPSTPGAAAADDADGTSTPGAAAADDAGLPSEVAVHVTSQPPGAEVLAGTRSLGTTPLLHLFPRGDAPVELTLRRAGYRDETRRVVPDQDRTVPVELRRIVRRPVSRPGHGRGHSGSSRTPPAHHDPVTKPPPVWDH